MWCVKRHPSLPIVSEIHSATHLLHRAISPRTAAWWNAFIRLHKSRRRLECSGWTGTGESACLPDTVALATPRARRRWREIEVVSPARCPAVGT